MSGIRIDVSREHVRRFADDGIDALDDMREPILEDAGLAKVADQTAVTAFWLGFREGVRDVVDNLREPETFES